MNNQVVQEDHTFEIGKTYMSKMATKEHFTVDKISRDPKTGKITKLYGRWEKYPHLTDCPLDPERLISPLAAARAKAQAEMSKETKEELIKLSKRFNLEDGCCPHCKKSLL